MGHLKEKYTKEYFTGKDEKGEDVGYGATLAYDKDKNLVLRYFDKDILDQINFEGKKVLSLGVGRGEELIYAHDNKSDKCVGVDFSESAIEIASENVKNRKISSIELVTEDALVFLNNYSSKNEFEKFDIVIMFDFIEHVPRKELREVIDLLKKVLNKKSIIIINTPAYKYDNDVLRDGFNGENLVNCIDTSDTNEATKGMHCNKYTIVSLQLFMEECGFSNVTEMHFFVLGEKLPENFKEVSYKERWMHLHKEGYPIKNNYKDDIVEYPYSDKPKLVWKKFKEGNLSDISLLITDEYAKIAYDGGNIDSQIFSDPLFDDKSKKITMFDVGAFMGADSFAFAKKMGENGHVVAFEPNIYNRNRLFLNLSHNPFLHGKVSIVPYALSDKKGKIKMNISANIDNGHSSTSRISTAHSKIDNALLPEGFFESNVDVVTLDEFVNNTGIIPDIIKIDIEGAEHLMLTGSMKTIEKYKPIIYTEIHSEYCAITCYKLFESLNYNVSIIHEEDDNRLMIKAAHNDEFREISERDLMIKSQINLNSSIETMKNFSLILQKIIRENDKLTSENNSLTVENDKLTSENNSLTVENDKLIDEINKLRDENDNLRIEVKNLNVKYQGLANSMAVHYSNKIKKVVKRIGIMK